ncbi:MAG TPA: sensor histidine kinase [Candidatus Dormibacteraeota bacterium]
MAQDVVAPQTRHDNAGGWLHAGVGLLRKLDLPTPPALPSVAYTPALVGYVVGTYAVAIALAVVCALTVHVRIDPPTLIVGGAAIFLMALYAIRQRPPANITWTPTMFVHLGLSVALGPAGAAAGAVSESLGVSIRSRGGAFRTFFNMSNHFLADVAAWAVFAAINDGGTHGTGGSLVAGLAAGFVHFTVNSGLVAVVIRLSDRKVSIVGFVRSRLWVFPISIAYGFAAFTFVIVHSTAGAVGFTALLAPVIVLHVYLIFFEQGTYAHAQQAAAFQKEREELLRKEAEASERERTKIAGDLHDGVVQNLAGMALMLSAEASQLKAHQNGDAKGTEALIELLNQSASDARDAMKDLRTLIIDLAPPTLRREGLQAALLEVLAEMKRKGTNTQLDLPPNLRLRKDRAALIFRVAQEVLRNVAAHAQAKNVTVELSTEDGAAVLSIQDDGKGFSEADVARRRAEGHLGTSAIVDRAEEAGGTLTIDSEPGRGTLVVLTLPI